MSDTEGQSIDLSVNAGSAVQSPSIRFEKITWSVLYLASRVPIFSFKNQNYFDKASFMQRNGRIESLLKVAVKYTSTTALSARYICTLIHYRYSIRSNQVPTIKVLISGIL